MRIKDNTKGQKDPCEECNGTNCPPFAEAGITCTGIEELKIILDSARQNYCKDCDGKRCMA